MKYSYAILGGTGHIGAALSEQLLKEGKSVLVIGHDAAKEKNWTAQGAYFETADVLDYGKLEELFAQSERIFMLNPPADPSQDAEAQELKHIQSIRRALEGLRPKKIVLASTYGARQGSELFDLGTLYELEQELKKHGAPLAIIRSAYYMSNFDLPVEMAMEDGALTTLFPAGFKLPMVAPADIGSFAAKLIQDGRTGTFYIQAREEYSAHDVAKILTNILHKNIKPNEIPAEDWASYMRKAGFSRESTRSFIGMTKLTMNEKFTAAEPVFGETTLAAYLKQLVDKLGLHSKN